MIVRHNTGPLSGLDPGAYRPKKALLEKPGQLAVSRVDDTTSCIHVGGTWRLSDTLPSDEELERDFQAAKATPRVAFETQALGEWDTSLITVLDMLIERCHKRGLEVDYGGLPEGVRRLLALAEAVPEATPPAARRPSLPSQAAHTVAGTARSVARSLAFLGDAAVIFGRWLLGRARHRREDLLREIQKAGARALPTVTLISFLLGVILAFAGGVTLRHFGATVYVGELVAVAMVRELGPIMTGVIMAGRTGSAYAAELGSMRVSEEIDALQTMGIPPDEFLVLNRVLALTLMMPLLCVYANFVGIVGGGLVAVQLLGVTVAQYAQEVKQAVDFTSFAIGVGKGAVFGVLVAMCGCAAGLRAARNAAAVGDAATRAVVSGIVRIIVADGVFSVVFYALGV
jgi:phospholipid/cholesterol/gamma-HCH transport system permease protein